jgi:carbohydrate kinase (thermoresistant glucokinase family)
MSTAPSPLPFEGARLIVVMGVSSSGKSTVGQALARRLHAPFLEGDKYHPEVNIEKMSAGIPLTDADRWPWLESLALAMHEAGDKKGVAVSACSALKRSYRDFMTEKAGEPILFVYLEGSKELIAARMRHRPHHFMPLSLLDSQFATLEPPATDENVLPVPVDEAIQKSVDMVVKALPYLKSFKRKQ